MKQSFRYFTILLGLIFSLNVSIVSGQKETFDLISFNPPMGWNKTPQGDVLMFSAPDKSDGTFCLATLYKSSAGSGNVSSDFSTVWKELAVNRLKISTEPQMENISSDGDWSNVSGSAAFMLDTIPAAVVITTMSSRTVTMSILVITNSQAYTDDLNSFFSSIEIVKNAAEPPVKAQQAENFAVTGSLTDYIFDVPPGWTKEVTAGEIVLKGRDNISVISILPMQQSSGDLDKDMSTIFWQVFDGWRPDEWNPDNHISTKGSAASGWSYFKDEMGIAKTEGEKNFKSYGFVFLAQLGDKVAIIAGSYPSKMTLLDEEANVDWQLLFHSLNFKNYPSGNVSTLQKDILGEWLTGGSSGLSTYTFAANGRYSWGGAFSSSRDVSQYKVLETTTSFVGDGKYSIKGNELTMTSDKTNIQRVEKVRVFYQKQYGDWQKRIGMMDLAPADGKLYEVTMAYQKQ
jgi:hypothetical protein